MPLVRRRHHTSEMHLADSEKESIGYLDYDSKQTSRDSLDRPLLRILYCIGSFAMLAGSVHAVQWHLWYPQLFWINVAVSALGFGVTSFSDRAQRSWLVRVALLLNVLSVLISTVRLSTYRV
jgi:hypothetical protein